uniref:Guanylate-binding protein n=1 Tax=Rhipicephalus appendiculatus TaxID=34631 RepID=A0A131YMY8_RHIAP
MNNIKEDDLQHLQFFAEYGRLAQNEKEGNAFQKLLFLVRDWNWPHEREFGSVGGSSLIASRLEIRDGQDTELQTLRQSILSCFSYIDCFLMPHPGEKVAWDRLFDGRLADIKEVFREKLLEFVPSILAPENMLVKEINGRKLSCQDLMIFFKAYVDVFKGGDLPKPTSMLLATANASNMAAMDKARKHYMSGMTNRSRRDLDKLREFHGELLAEALKVFEDFPKIGSDAMSSTSMDVLTKELEQCYDVIIKEEEELIKTEREEEAKREKERCEELQREEERERERALEKERAAAREAEFARERAETSSRVARLEERLRKAERNPVAKFFKGIGLILATPLAAVFYPPALPDMAEEIGESFTY